MGEGRWFLGEVFLEIWSGFLIGFCYTSFVSPAYSQFTLPTFWWKTIEETPGYKPQHHLTTSRTLKNTYVLPVHGRELEYNPVMPCGSANNFVGQTSECFLNLHIASYSCWPLSALSNGQKKKEPSCCDEIWSDFMILHDKTMRFLANSSWQILNRFFRKHFWPNFLPHLLSATSGQRMHQPQRQQM